MAIAITQPRRRHVSVFSEAARSPVAESARGPELDLEHELVGKVSTFCAKECSEEMES
jgi:hypothetical protein